MQKAFLTFLIVVSLSACRSNESAVIETMGDDSTFTEKHRPQLHFSPEKNWMNDPNGMVYHAGQYHLFYQYYPDGLKWGPMHWGHAVSTDLLHWKHLPIALYPDTLGYIFSGSAVVDHENTSGFGSKDNPPLVAVFTYHSAEKEKAGRTDYQTQGIAFSLDSGRTWSKYEGNPVLKNPGARDFRDPKVFWHQPTSKWIMVLAVKDHVELWASADFKSWSKLSEFGFESGAHGGVWECPDLFLAEVEGEERSKWVMIVSINPGGINGGSATQYFTGHFDGKTFTPDDDHKTTKWLDYGPDNYAGVTYANAPDDRNIFMGWMSNWAYAQEVPTTPWRSAMTLPRELSLRRIGDRLHLTSTLSPEVASLAVKTLPAQHLDVKDAVEIKGEINFSQAMVTGSVPAKDFAIELFNDQGQKVEIGYQEEQNRFFINRAASGKNDFSPNFRPELHADRISNSDSMTFTFVADVSSVEVFFDDGLSVMTAIYFPDAPLRRMRITATKAITVHNLRVSQLKSVWRGLDD